jgi:mRNA interferase YafQ
MLLIKRTKDFDRSFARLKRAGIKAGVIADLEVVIDTLSREEKLAARYRDHTLRGEYHGYRECHIRNDLLLVYQIRKTELIVVLVDIGTHSYLF